MMDKSSDAYHRKFLQTHLKDLHLIDFPGMFDSKGEEIDITIDLTLQMIIRKARSCKILLLIPASHFRPENRSQITLVKSKLA